MAFWNKKKLIDYDPKSLDLVKLTLVEQSLTAKLMLVNNELIRRYTNMIETVETADAEESRKLFAGQVARLTKLNVVLEGKLAREA
jgi:hypothetical protein